LLTVGVLTFILLVENIYTKKSLLCIGGPVFVKVPEPIAPVNKDEAVRFECIIEANPKPTVNWLVIF
jgi:hypothetical protein